MKKTVLDFYHAVFTLSLSTSIAAVLMVLLVSGRNVPAAPDPVSPVTLNIAPAAGSYTAAVAEVAGLFRKHGLHVELRLFDTEREAVDRLLAGEGTFTVLSGHSLDRVAGSPDAAPLEVVGASGQAGVLGSGDSGTGISWVLAGTRSNTVDSEVPRRVRDALEEAGSYLRERPLAARMMIDSVFGAGAGKNRPPVPAVYVIAVSEPSAGALLE